MECTSVKAMYNGVLNNTEEDVKDYSSMAPLSWGPPNSFGGNKMLESNISSEIMTFSWLASLFVELEKLFLVLEDEEWCW